ncbi:MAG: hypothetical protein M3220_15470 [Chloroflexota bacterium]|nr:hypothetical protein [Chloroflexota bacterium]
MNTLSILFPFFGVRKVALALGAIAIVIVASHASAQSTDMIKVQGEAMSHVPQDGTSIINDSAAEGGQALRYTNSAVARKSVTWSKASQEIVVRARATQSGGSPRVEVRLKNGSTITSLGERTVPSNTYAEYRFPHSANPGETREVQIKARNTSATSRNLYVDYFRVPDGPSDTTPPETTITSGPSGTGNDSAATFAFSSNESGSTFLCSLDGAAYSSCVSPKSYSGLADGQHTFRVKAKDAAGNEDATPASRTWTVQTSAIPEVQAKSAYDFWHSIGVVTHFKFTNTGYITKYETQIKPALGELGVKHVRDHWVDYDDSRDAQINGKFADLYDTYGIKSILHPNMDSFGTTMINAAKVNELVAEVGPGLEAVEGANEHNGTNLDGSNPDWGEELRQYHTMQYNAVQNSNHPDLPVACPSILRPYPDISEIPQLTGLCDWRNMHSYPGGNPPHGAKTSDPPGYSRLLDSDVPMANYLAGKDTGFLVASETGYQTSTNSQGISEAAHAIYAPRLSLEYFRVGVSRGYHYQLYDWRNNGITDPESNFGLMAYNFRKKPVFRAMENMIDIVEDPGGPCRAGSLAYDLENASADVHSVLLQKCDGTFYLALWQEVRSYDRNTDQLISVSPQNVTVQFPSAMKTVRVFDPTNIASSGPADDAETHPSRTLSSVSQLTEPIGDQVKIIQVTKP